MAGFDHAIDRGDTRTFRITCHVLGTTDPYPLAGKIVWFSAKRRRGDPDSAAVFVKKLGDPGFRLDPDAPGNNVALVTLAEADTLGVTGAPYEVLHCRVRVKDPAADPDEVFTAARGILRVEPGGTTASPA